MNAALNRRPLERTVNFATSALDRLDFGFGFVR